MIRMTWKQRVFGVQRLLLAMMLVVMTNWGISTILHFKLGSWQDLVAFAIVNCVWFYTPFHNWAWGGFASED